MPQRLKSYAFARFHSLSDHLRFVSLMRDFTSRCSSRPKASDTLTHPNMDLSPFLGGRMELDLMAGLIAGLASSLHCLAMCGGVAAAIGVNAGQSGGRGGAVARRVSVLLQAQLARVAIYVGLGLVAGSIGWGLMDMPLAGDLHVLTRWIAALVLVVAAYTVAEIPLFGGAAGRFGAKLASPVYRRLHHLHRLGPVGLGAAWGLMPCAMVYLTTFYAGLTGSALQGGLVMLGFGLGTLPMLTLVGTTAGSLTELASKGWLKAVAAVALVMLAAVTVSGLI